LSELSGLAYQNWDVVFGNIVKIPISSLNPLTGLDELTRSKTVLACT